MNKHQEMVRDFHKAFGLTISESPSFPSERDAKLRVSLIAEEVDEFKEAVEERDMTKAADALADILYVVYGAGVTFGIDLEEVYSEVHRSNMTKVWPDGTVHRRSDGKVEKPPTYSRADVSGVLSKLGNKMEKTIKSGKIEILHQKPQ
jgi:predicted HAD superfamily Cof-like phosphohydrolase